MGLLRLFLALSVIAGHAQTTVFSFYGIGAQYAVSCFFIISGFYMAMILNEKFKNINPIHFYKSRALRIFPAYYAGAFIAIFVSFGSIVDFYNHLSISAKFYFIFQNIFIFGQDLSYLFCVQTTSNECASPVGMTINPPAWSLAVELGFYLVAPYILKSEKKTFAFVLLGLGYFISINSVNFPLDLIEYFRPSDITAFTYYFYPSSFIFFGGGALAYHLSKRNLEPHYFSAIFAIALLTFTQTIMPFWHLLFMSMAIPVLFDYTATNRIDRSIGELSYPTYILHFPVLLFIRPFTQSHPQWFNFIGLGSWVAIVSCAIGLLIYLTIEKRVSKYRSSKTFFSNKTLPKDNSKNCFHTAIIWLYVLLPIVTIIYICAIQSSTDKFSSTPYNLTDNNWVNGIGINLTGFFVKNSRSNLDHYQVGKIIMLSNGETRQINRVEQSGVYLNIFLNGQPLDGKQVGYPNKIEIVD